MLRQDYVMRLVEKMGQVLARLARRRETEQHEAALELLRSSCDELFRVDPALLEMLDSDSLESLVGAPEDAPHLARLLRHQVDTLRALGREADADALAPRALVLFAAAAGRGTLDASQGFDEDIVHLLSTTPPERLDPAVLARLTPP